LLPVKNWPSSVAMKALNLINHNNIFPAIFNVHPNMKCKRNLLCCFQWFPAMWPFYTFANIWVQSIPYKLVSDVQKRSIEEGQIQHILHHLP
jgi:hypothetical protein